ncbi:acyltransferase family protein [Kineococcus radiotolerans]|uniref:acyltransferase family protein n=1 Tax=Kineococcus radiotolerans TaxID=131568 RepID=UPI0006767618|nr:acyltransferase [Kineococcus radiotolerans]
MPPGASAPGPPPEPPPAAGTGDRSRPLFPRPRAAAPSSPPAAARRTGSTLATAFDPRSNSLDVLRLVLAATVAVVHTTLLGFGHQPRTGSTDLGSLAVDGFFVLSGFLVAASYLRLNSLRRYLWHRALRILPGFWLSLLLTAAVIAPLLAVLTGRSATSVFTGPDSALSYLSANAALLMRQFGIAGLPGLGGAPDVLNGALWTLFFEAACYGIVAVLGVLGVLRRRRWVVLALLGGLWVLTIAATAGFNPLGSELMLRFAFVFLLGAAAHLFADRVPVRGSLALVSVVLVVAGLYLLPDHRALAGPAFAYVVLYAVVRSPLRCNLRWDLSYGVYVWHWPIAQVLVAAGATAVTTVPFVLLSLAVTAVVAALSWNLVEHPVLGWKDAAWVTRASSPGERR